MAVVQKQCKNVEYQFCKICKRNHNDGRKHIYSNKHKQKLASVLKKFGSKITDAKSFLSKASVIDGEMEPGCKIWCYCCEIEINKHTTDGDTTIEQGGVLEHIASSDHHKKTMKFWWENGIDKSKLQSFIVFEAELDGFKKSVSKQMSKLDAIRENRTKQIAEQIRQTESLQAQIVAGTRKELSFHSSPQPLFPPSTTATSSSSNTTTYYNSKRNVHTGATPPWLLEDCDGNNGCYGNTAALIGPSEEEFCKWQEKHKKSKKNPKRVGANFHRDLKRLGLLDKDDDNWLPNFGRVWNAGPRSHTMKEFRNELANPLISIDTVPSCTIPSSSTSSIDPLITSSVAIPSYVTPNVITNVPSSIPSYVTPSMSIHDISSYVTTDIPSSIDMTSHVTPNVITDIPSSIDMTSYVPAIHDIPSNVTIQPYVRKRPLKRSHPDHTN